MWADFLQHTGLAGDVHVPLPNKACRYSNSRESPREIDSLAESFSEIYTDDDLQLQWREAGIVDSWRNWNDLEQLAILSGFNSYGRRIFDSVFEVSNVLTQDFTIQKYIIQQAHKYYKDVKDDLQSSEYYNRGIQWLDDHTAPHEEDRIVSMFLEFVQIGLSYKANHRPKYRAVCRMFLPADSPVQMAEDAFHQVPENQRDISRSLVKKINKYFEKYTSSYLAPYTSLVGPSGVGKSYAIQHMARKGIYVIYASFAHRGSSAYPRRSLLADEIQPHDDREKLTIYFECYVAAGMANTFICREKNISPLGLFDIEVKSEFSLYRKRLHECVNFLYQDSQPHLTTQTGRPRTRSNATGDREFDYRGYINAEIGAYTVEAAKIFDSFLKVPKYRKKYASQHQLCKDFKPQAVFCFDEAQALLDRWGQRGPIHEMKFLALRRALRHQSKTSKDVDDKRFFALFLGTTGTVSEFSPPTPDDLSLRLAGPEEMDLFPPIYKISTFDIFAVDESKGWEQLYNSLRPEFPDRSLDYWCYLGRPLWGALFPKYSLEDLHKLAAMKIFRGRTQRGTSIAEVEALALLSYRINFTIKLPSLAEKLTAGYMLYIDRISARRVLLETAQVSEPMLASCSHREMSLKSSESRLQIVKQLYSSATNGTINSGDIGEIVAALVMLFSFDRGLSQGAFRPMKLSRFLDFLLPGKIHQQFVEYDLKALWEHGHVFFNHFGRMEEAPSEKILRTAFYRGAAMFTKEMHPGCDIMIPVLLPERGKEMSFIAVQVKNRKKDVLEEGLRNGAQAALRNGLGDLSTSIAHIGLMLALKGKKGREDADIVYPVEHQKKELRSSHEAQTTGKYSFNDMHRVVAAIVGMDLDLYPGLIHPNDNRETPDASSGVLYILKALLALYEDEDDDDEYHQQFRVFRN